MNRWVMLLICALAITAISCGDDNNDSNETGNSTSNGGDSTEKPSEIIHEIVVTSKDCDNGETYCVNMCVDLTSSAQNCGECGNKCDSNQICYKSECRDAIVAEVCDKTLCSTGCTDITSDNKNCGMCGNVCGENMICKDSTCVCDSVSYDCDGSMVNGCESYTICECTVGQQIPCYFGPEGTQGVGECKAGTKTCELDDYGYLNYGFCEGEVTPVGATLCTDKDYNCNGIPDGMEDGDGDGYTICDGDLCDNTEMCSVENPELINPGMMEVPNNNLDDDCDGVIDEVDNGANATPVSFTYGSSDLETTARALAQAMGIVWECKAGENCAYGLVSAKLTRSSSASVPDKRQVNILPSMRDASGISRIIPQEGSSFAILSTGEATDVYGGVKKTDLELEAIKSETTTATGEKQRVSAESVVPEIYASNHGGKLQSHAACQTSTVVPAIFDSVQLHLELKVPVNAKGFQFDFRFLSREYVEYVCSPFNDFFLALLSTKHEELKAYPDHNIAFDRNGNPVSINNGFFTTCSKKPCTTLGNDAVCPAFMSCTQTTEGKYCMESEDTCMDGATAISAYYPEPYNGTTGRGGGTAWLTTKAPVVGGETISLDFYIWDTQDRKYDSSVLLDNFKWLVDETKVTTGRAEDEPGVIL